MALGRACVGGRLHSLRRDAQSMKPDCLCSSLIIVIEGVALDGVPETVAVLADGLLAWAEVGIATRRDADPGADEALPGAAVLAYLAPTVVGRARRCKCVAPSVRS
jgi:hypothetical protein